MKGRVSDSNRETEDNSDDKSKDLSEDGEIENNFLKPNNGTNVQ